VQADVRPNLGVISRLPARVAVGKELQALVQLNYSSFTANDEVEVSSEAFRADLTIASPPGYGPAPDGSDAILSAWRCRR
jgi:hypothetical protein